MHPVAAAPRTHADRPRGGRPRSPPSARSPAPARRPNGRVWSGELMAAATEDEQRFLFGLLTGEVRQGALDAVAVEGLAQATGAPAGGRTAGGDARRFAADGGAGAARRRPGRRWAASGSPSAARCCRCWRTAPRRSSEAVDKLGACAVEEKLDGIRVQVHRDGDDVRIYTRTLDDITDRLPELTAAARELKGERFILDGEVIALDEDGRPRSVPGDRRAGGLAGGRGHGRRRGARLPRLLRRRCPSTATICWTCRSPSGTRSWRGWCPSRCGCGARSWPDPEDAAAQRRREVPRRHPAPRPRGRRRARPSTPPTARAGAAPPG